MRNNLKHIIALLLVLVMSFQLATFTFADEAAATDEAVEEAYVIQNMREFEILNALGIFAIYEKEDFTGNGELSRAEAAAVAARMVGIVDGYSMEGKEMPYYDVEGTDTYAYEIYHMTNMGIMSGYEGEFNPDGAITEEQFVKVVVEALGYGIEAKSMGGYPHGYTITAGKYHILDNVDFKGAVPLTQDVAVQIIYNCLDVETPDVVSVDNGGFMSNVGGTIMNDNLDVYRTYGVLNRNPNTFLGIGDPSIKGVVEIDDDRYLVGTTDCDQYLGYNVEIFYKQTKDDEMGTILYVAPFKNEVTRLEADVISDFRNHKYYYFDGRKDQSIRIPTGTDVVYNGVIIGEGFTDYEPQIGYVDLIDNDEDGNIDVISIVSYDVYVVQANNTAGYVLVAENGKQLKDYDKAYWNVVDAEGNELPAAKVPEEMVLLLAVSSNQKVVKGFQVTEQIEGTIDSTSKIGGKDVIEINGVNYKPFTGCKLGKAGDFVGYYVYENILLVKCLPASSLTESVGYLIDVGVEPGIDTKVMLRMLLQTGEVQVVNVAKKAKLVIYGNADVTDPTQFRPALEHDIYKYKKTGKETSAFDVCVNDVIPQPVIYKLNANGEVVYLEAAPGHNVVEGTIDERVDIPEDTDGFNLVEVVRAPYARFNPGIRNVEDRIVLDENSFVIDIPPEDSEDDYEAYRIYRLSDVTTADMDRNTTVDPWRLYRTGNDIVGANIMVGTSILSATGGSTFIIDSIGESLTDEGEECYVLSGKDANFNTITMKTKDKAIVDNCVYKDLATGTETPVDVSIGDMVTCRRNTSGLVNEIVMSYDFDHDDATDGDEDTSKRYTAVAQYLYAGTHIAAGQVYLKKGTMIGYYNGDIESNNDDPTSSTHVSFKNIGYLDTKGFEVVVFDVNNTRGESHMTPASIGDIKAYLDDPANVSSILVVRQKGEPKLLIIYKK